MCWTTTTTSLSPPSTHTHTHPGRFLSPPHVCSSIRAPGISYYMKRELNPFPFFFESNETEHITSNQYTDGREREKPPFRSNSFPALSPHAAAEPSWAGRKSMVTPFFFFSSPSCFSSLFLLRISSSSSSSHLLLCAQRAAMQPYKSRFSSTPSTCRSRKTPHEKIDVGWKWVSKQSRCIKERSTNDDDDDNDVAIASHCSLTDAGERRRLTKIPRSAFVEGEKKKIIWWLRNFAKTKKARSNRSDG